MKANVCLYFPTSLGNLRTHFIHEPFLFEKCSDLERLLRYGLFCTCTNYFLPMCIKMVIITHFYIRQSLMKVETKTNLSYQLLNCFIWPILWPNIKGSNSIMVLDARIYNILPIERIWRNGKWHQKQMWHRINSVEQFISRVYGNKVLKVLPSFTCKSVS